LSSSVDNRLLQCVCATIGELGDAGFDLPGLVAAGVLLLHFDRRFVVLVDDRDALAGEAFGLAAADPLAHHRRLAEEA
jgi:hypothetical protein